MPLAPIKEIKGKKAGLYAISPVSGAEDPTKPLDIKIGRSIDIRNRLNGYHTCFPEGFFIISLLYISTGNTKKRLLEISSDLEVEAFRRLRPYHKQTTARRYGEWFTLSYNQLKGIFVSLKNDIPKVTKVITSFQDDHITEFNVDGEKITPEDHRRLIDALLPDNPKPSRQTSLAKRTLIPI